jgi:hypothetical protein
VSNARPDRVDLEGAATNQADVELGGHPAELYPLRP